MRKPRDFDSELKALNDKARQLKERKLHQLGELVIATGADALPVEILAGVLLATMKHTDVSVREGWRKAGASFFQHARRNARGPDRNDAPAAASASGTLPFACNEGAR